MTALRRAVTIAALSFLVITVSGTPATADPPPPFGVLATSP